MKNLQLKKEDGVEGVFNNYPESVKCKLLNLRKLILEVANDTDEIEDIEETLKWGEPSYLVENGSTIRIHWKDKNPDHYAIYFKCTSKLVATFRLAFNNLFKYEGNRAIIFHLEDIVPESELKECIYTALTYNNAKKLPLLGL